MNKENKKLFQDKRWTEYQPVDVVGTKVKLTKEHKQKIKLFDNYIKEKNDKSTNK